MTPSPAGAAPDARHLTKQQFVYRMIRHAIIRCELKPGERLIIDELARRYEISIIPVREALRLLQSEGLVTSVAHVGATVGPISRDSVLEVFTVLEGLEVVATRMAAQRATAEHVEAIAELVSSMDEALTAESPQRWADLNTQFHLQIAQTAGMPVLLEMTQRALDLWDRVRRYYFNGVLVRRLQQAQTEHHLILEQLRARDAEALERTVRQHNRSALAAYTDYLESIEATQEPALSPVGNREPPINVAQRDPERAAERGRVEGSAVTNGAGQLRASDSPVPAPDSRLPSEEESRR